MDISTTLEQLVGEHILTGVDETNRKREKYGQFEDCQCINFVLDGKTYTAIEDPSDGYRSSMEEIYISEEKVSNTFAPVKVLARLRTSGRHYGSDEVLELIDVKNGKVVLEVGTENVDDYYPGFVASWKPENLSLNEIAPLDNAPC